MFQNKAFRHQNSNDINITYLKTKATGDSFYLCLNHVWSMQPHPVHKGLYSHCFFILELLKEHVQGYDCAGPTYSGTETQVETKVGIEVRIRSV